MDYFLNCLYNGNTSGILFISFLVIGFCLITCTSIIKELKENK